MAGGTRTVGLKWTVDFTGYSIGTVTTETYSECDIGNPYI
jgi:hypothetical protein